MGDPQPILQTYGLTKRFRGFVAVDGVDLSIREGSIHALVGPNGAGKTTLFNMLCGFVRPSAGKVVLHGEEITHLAPDQIARRRVGRSFQITSLFEQLSVIEHVSLALQAATGLGYRFWASDRALARFRPRATELLAEVGLEAAAEREAHTLAYGQKRALELALVLALDPLLLLLDEPTAGMGIEELGPITSLIRRIAGGRTVVLVEHNMGVVGELADRVTVLQRGSVLAEGPYAEVRQDPRVVAAYLGQVEETAGDAQG
jgi:branched-chain amino acid transport system ATP-binding protein